MEGRAGGVGKLRVSAFLAKRFLLGSRRGLPKTVSLLALFGIALGAASLVVAMGLMSGYRHDLAEKLAGTSAEVIAMPEPGANVPDQRSALRALPNVAAIARTAFAPALLLSPRAPEGVDALVKALELPDGLTTTRLLGAVPDLAQSFAGLEAKGATPVLLGAGLAKRLGASVGETIVLETSSAALAAGLSVAARTPVTVAAVVETGFSEVDDGWAVVPLAVFERLAPPGARQGVWEMKLLGDGATVLDWKVLNRDLFEALAIQQTLLFIVLTLIVAVAAGTVVSSLVVLLAEKTRDVGVLAALGASPVLVARTFRRDRPRPRRRLRARRVFSPDGLPTRALSARDREGLLPHMDAVPARAASRARDPRCRPPPRLRGVAASRAPGRPHEPLRSPSIRVMPA